jgi:hypothetical protein
MWDKMKLKYIFDLKGSLINRETKINMKKYKPGTTLKDINLLNVRQGENILKFSTLDRACLMDMVEKDAHLLRKHNIMDYSLLLAIETNQMYKGHQGSSSGRNSDYFGIGSIKSLNTPKNGFA